MTEKQKKRIGLMVFRDFYYFIRETNSEQIELKHNSVNGVVYGYVFEVVPDGVRFFEATENGMDYNHYLYTIYRPKQ